MTLFLYYCTRTEVANLTNRGSKNCSPIFPRPALVTTDDLGSVAHKPVPVLIQSHSRVRWMNYLDYDCHLSLCKTCSGMWCCTWCCCVRTPKFTFLTGPMRELSQARPVFADVCVVVFLGNPDPKTRPHFKTRLVFLPYRNSLQPTTTATSTLPLANSVRNLVRLFDIYPNFFDLISYRFRFADCCLGDDDYQPMTNFRIFSKTSRGADFVKKSASMISVAHFSTVTKPLRTTDQNQCHLV
jgi:hypothetical protein